MEQHIRKLPRVGDVVLYRYASHEKVDYTKPMSSQTGAWATNAQDVCPAVIVSVHGPACVNLRLFTDGDIAPPRKTSVLLGTSAGMWQWRGDVVTEVGLQPFLDPNVGG